MAKISNPAFGVRGKALAIALLLPLALLASRPAFAVDAEQASALVRSAAADTLAAFAGKKQSPAQARAALHQIIGRYGDMNTESQHILGRYWTKANSDSQQEFAALLERFVIASFGGMIDEIPAGQRIEVKGAEVQGDRVVVHSIASSPGEEPAALDWIVVDNAAGGRPVIVDLSVYGVAMVTTLKADFTSVIRSASGRLEALFEPLRRKVSALGDTVSGS